MWLRASAWKCTCSTVVKVHYLISRWRLMFLQLKTRKTIHVPISFGSKLDTRTCTHNEVRTKCILKSVCLDFFSVVSLPNHFTKSQTIMWKKQLSRRVCLRSDYLRQAKWKLKVNTEWLKTTRTSGSTYADAGPSFKR